MDLKLLLVLAAVAVLFVDWCVLLGTNALAYGDPRRREAIFRACMVVAMIAVAVAAYGFVS